MSATYKTTRRVEFRDTDAAGIAHFSAFFAFMEQAEHELLRHLGLNVLLRDATGSISWPRVSAQCDFRGAARFEDVIQIEVRVQRLGNKSVTYAFQFSHDGRPIAEGQMTSVCCRLASDAAPQSIPIPDSFAEKLASLASS